MVPLISSVLVFFSVVHLVDELFDNSPNAHGSQNVSDPKNNKNCESLLP